jgi:hypothetical protein
MAVIEDMIHAAAVVDPKDMDQYVQFNLMLESYLGRGRYIHYGEYRKVSDLTCLITGMWQSTPVQDWLHAQGKGQKGGKNGKK